MSVEKGAQALLCQRSLFDIPENVAYFNCAGNSPQLNETRARLRMGADSKSRPWERTSGNFFEDAETLRVLSAGLFGGDADGYVVIPAASYGLSTAARALEVHLSPGDQIVVLGEAFPSNYLPWERVARERGAVIVTVPVPTQGGWTEAVLSHIDSTVKAVAVPHCHWTNGAFVDLVKIGQACRAVGAMLAVDATQSLGAFPLSIDEVQPDFLVAAGYKWLLSPYGFGLMYVAPSWRESRPLEEVWLTRDNAENFAALVNYSPRYKFGARRFEVGEKCTTLLPGAVAAFERLSAWGITHIAQSLGLINARIASRLEILGFMLPEERERCPHMFGARLPVHYQGNLVAALAAQNIFISQRGNAMRFSPHLHVSDFDVERLLSAIEGILTKRE